MIYHTKSSSFMNGHCYAYVYHGTKPPTRSQEILTRIGTFGTIGAPDCHYYDCYKLNLEGDSILVESNSQNVSHGDTIAARQMNNLGLFWDNDSTGKRLYGYKKFSADDFKHSVVSDCGNYYDKGITFIPNQYVSAGCFFNGYARVELNTGELGYIDTTGQLLFKFKEDM